jgi:hypothetical protein
MAASTPLTTLSTGLSTSTHHTITSHISPSLPECVSCSPILSACSCSSAASPHLPPSQPSVGYHTTHHPPQLTSHLPSTVPSVHSSLSSTFIGERTLFTSAGRQLVALFYACACVPFCSASSTNTAPKSEPARNRSPPRVSRHFRRSTEVVATQPGAEQC